MGFLGAVIHQLENAGQGVENFGRQFVDDPNDPLVRAAGSPVGQAVMRGLSYADIPRKFSTDVIGNMTYYAAMLEHNLGVPNQTNWDAIRHSYDQGGGRAVWENNLVANMNRPERFVADLLVDPLTYVPFVGEGAKGLEAAGLAARTAEGAGLGEKALGYGAQGAGKALGGLANVGEGINKVQDLAFKPLTWPAGQVAKRVPGVARLTELSAASQDKQFTDYVARHTSTFLKGSVDRPDATAAGQSGKYVVGALQDLRNAQYKTPAAATTAAAGERAKRVLGIVSGADQSAAGITPNIGSPRMVNVSGDMIPAWTSEAQRTAAVDYAAHLMAFEAPLQSEYQGLRGAIEGLNNFRSRITSDLGQEYDPLVPDIYRAAYERFAPGQFPEPVFSGQGMASGRNAGLGGGFNGDITNPKDMIEHGAAYAAAQMQLSREGGTVRQFLPGGAYHGMKGKSVSMPVNLRELINQGGVGDEGLRLMSKDEFAQAWTQHVGALNATPEDIDKYWHAGLDLWYKRMVESAQPWIGKLDRAGNQVFKGGLPVAGEKETRAATQAQLLPNRAEMLRQIGQGEAGSQFYEGNLAELRSKFESAGDYDLFLQFMAAGSPRNGVTQNAKDAFRHWVDYKANNWEPLIKAGWTPDELQQLGRTNVGLQNDMETRRALFQQVQHGDPVESQKVGSFYSNYREATRADQFRSAFGASDEQQRLLDEVLQSERMASGAATMDSHHARAMSLGDSYDNPTYQMQEQAVSTVAHEYGLSPREAQAAIWLTSKGEQGFVTKDAGIQQQVLEHIANTPVEKVNLGTGEVETFGAQNMQEALGPQMEMRVKDWYDKATAAAETAVRKSSYDGGAAIVTPDLKLYEAGRREARDKAIEASIKRTGEPPMWAKTGDNTYTAQVAGGKTIKSVEPKLQPADFDKMAGRKDGAVLASMVVDSVDNTDVAHAVVKFKLGMQDAFNEDWGNWRIAINSDTADGSTKISALYFPRNDTSVETLQRIADSAFEANKGDWNLQTANAPITARSLVLADRSLAKSGGWNTVSNTPNVEKWAGTELRHVRAGTSYGATFEPVPGTSGSIQFRKMEDFPLNPDGTHQKAVALASAGTNGVLSPEDKKAITEIGAFLKANQPIMQTRNASLYKFGLFHDDKLGETFDLTIPAINAKEADEIGSLTNQIAYYDPDLGDSVPVSGGLHNSDSPFKTPQQIAQLVDAIRLSREQGGTVADALAQLKATTPSASAVGFVAGPRTGAVASRLAQVMSATPDQKMGAMLNSPIGQRLSKWFEDRFAPWSPLRAQGTDAFRNGLNLDVQLLQDPMLQDRPWLSEDTARAMFDNKLEDGTTYGDYAQRVRSQAAYVKSQAQTQGITYERGLDPEKRAALFSDETSKKVIRDLGKMHQDPLYSTPEEVATNALQYKILKERGHAVERQGTYNLLKSAWSEVTLFSPRYQTANIATNAINAAIHGDVMGALQGITQLPVHIRGELKGGGEANIANAKIYDLMEDTGQGYIPQIASTGHRNLIGNQQGRNSSVRRLVNRVGLQNWGWVGKPFEMNAAIAQGVDNAGRSGVFQDAFESHWGKNADELYGKLTAAATKGGLTDVNGVDLLPNRNPKYLYQYYRGLGIKDGMAQRMSHDVAELVNAATNDAITNHVDKVYFNYYRTNLDDIVGKVIPFHYWASRATRFYAEEAMRNPALIANYYRLQAGIQRMNDDPGLNARQKGFIRLFQGLSGFTLMMNPDALMGVVKATGLADNYTPDGQTEFGGIVQRLKSNGIGLYPWFDSILNMIGSYGNTFEPDMLGIRHRALVGSTINWLRSEGVLGASNENPGASPYADLNEQARAVVSKWTSTFLPDWLSRPVEMQAGGTVGEVTLDKIIENRIMAENPNLTNEELVTIMNNPDDPKYKSAFQDAARAGVIGQMLSFTLPTSFKVRENSADVRAATNSLVRTEAKELGVQPEEVTPTNADMEFMAAYKAQTGKNFTVGQWQDANDKRALTFATPEGRKFILQENEYKSLGTPEAQKALQTYYAIQDGTAQLPELGNIAGLDQNARKVVADTWLARSGQNPAIQQMMQLQQAYKAAHPEFAQFKQWQRQIGNAQTLYGGDLTEYRRLVAQQNPNANAYFQAVIADLRKRGVPQDQWIAELDRATFSSNLWFEVTGRAQSVYDPAPQPNGTDPSAAMSGIVDQYNQSRPANQGPTWSSLRA